MERTHSVRIHLKSGFSFSSVFSKLIIYIFIFTAVSYVMFFFFICDFSAYETKTDERNLESIPGFTQEEIRVPPQ